MATKASELQAKLKKSDPVIRHYIAELEKRNSARQRQIVSLEADKVERDGRIKALEKQLKEDQRALHVQIQRMSPNVRDMSKEELIESFREFIPQLIEIGPALGLKIEPSNS